MFDELEHLNLEVRGVKLNAVAAGPRDGPLVILLHGFPEFSYGWRHQIEPLAAAGFRVVAPDQRGYNESSKPEGVLAYAVDELAADVAGIADALGRESFDVAGHDWGGIVAWWTALKYPGRVRRLIVANAPHPVAARKYIKTHRRQRFRSWYIGFFQVPRFPEWLLSRGDFALLKRALKRSSPAGLFTDEDLRRYRDAWSKPGALTAMLNWYRALMRFRAKGTSLTVNQPTLILWGDRDRFLEFGLAEASAVYCADARVVRLAGTSHWVQHEEPERVTAEMLAFLGEPKNG